MGISVKISGGSEEMLFDKDKILSVNFFSDTPNDSNTRATDLSVGLHITGKLTNEKDDDSKKIAMWSMVSAEFENAYRELMVEFVSAGVVVRKITLPNCFIIDYQEKFDTKNGSGTFELLVKQKKEKIADISLEGGYNA